jgi:hypothetical protein
MKINVLKYFIQKCVSMAIDKLRFIPYNNNCKLEKPLTQ